LDLGVARETIGETHGGTGRRVETGDEEHLRKTRDLLQAQKSSKLLDAHRRVELLLHLKTADSIGDVSLAYPFQLVCVGFGLKQQIDEIAPFGGCALRRLSRPFAVDDFL
jgi:hypothetical protein